MNRRLSRELLLSLSCLMSLGWAEGGWATRMAPGGMRPGGMRREPRFYEFVKPVRAIEVNLAEGRVLVEVGSPSSADDGARRPSKIMKATITKVVWPGLEAKNPEGIASLSLQPKLSDGKLVLAESWGDQTTERPQGAFFDVEIALPTSWSSGQAVDKQGNLPAIAVSVGSGGRVGVRGVRSALQVETGSTKVYLEDVEGTASVTTVDAPISGTGLALTSGRFASSGGDMHLELARIGEGDTIQATSSVGGITVLLPRNADCRVEADTTAGEIKTNIPELKDGLRYEGRSLRGVLGSGAGLLQIQSTTWVLQVDWLPTPPTPPPAPKPSG